MLQHRIPLDSRLFAGFGLFVVLLLGSAVVSYLNTQQLHDDSQWVTHTHEVIAALEDLLNAAVDAETGQRGYIISGEKEYLGPYNSALAVIHDHLNDLERLTADDSRRQDSISDIRTSVENRLVILRELIAKYDEQGFAAAQEDIQSDRGKGAMDLLRERIEEMTQAEYGLLFQRSQESRRSYQAAVTSEIISGVLGVLAIGLLLYIVTRSIRNRDRAAEIIHRERELLEITLGSIGDGVIATDPQGRVTMLNPIAIELTGWTQEDAAGQDLATVFHIVRETTDETVENPALRALEQGTIVGLANHTELVARDGSRRAIADSASPIRGRHGVVHGAVLVFRDVSADRKAENALRESEALKTAILDTALDAMITCDHEGRIIEFNPAAERIFGYPQAEAIGKELSALIVPARLRDRHKAGMIRYLETGKSTILGKRLELPALRADGTEFPAELAVTRISGEGPPKFTAYLRDITEQQRVNEQLAQRMQLLALSADLAAILAIGDELPTLLGACTDVLVKHLDGAFARIWTFNAEEDVLELQASSGMYTHLNGAHSRIPMGQFKIGLIAKNRQPHITNQVLGDSRIPEQKWAEENGLIAFAGYPLLFDDRLIGVIAMFAKHSLDEHTLSALATAARFIAAGIERSTTFSQLAEGRKLLEVTLASIGDAVMTTDADGKITFLNGIAQQLTGWSQQAAVGQPADRVFQIIEGSSGQVVESPVDNVIRQGVIVGLANYMVLIAKDGTRHPIDDSGAPIIVDGKNVGVVVVFRDVTERRKADEKLQESLENFRNLADNMTQFAWMTDETGYIFWYNQRWFDYTGTTLSEMQGWGWQAVHHPDHVARVTDKFKQTLAAGNSWEDTFPLRRQDGQYRWFLSRARPIYDADGKIIRWFGTNTDITELRELELALIEADQRKDQFLATLGHELRNPLAGILGGVEILESPAHDADDQIEAQRIIGRQARFMKRLIDDMLDVSRIVRGKVTLNKNTLDLTQLLGEVLQDCRRELDEKGLAIALEIGDAPIPMHGDRERLRQVFTNLIHNAGKFTEPGGNVSVILGKSHDDSCVIQIRDTGIGMSRETLDDIFHPFVQADVSHERDRGGLGLGLSIVKGLVEMHGGKVGAASEGLAQGSTFTVELPLNEEVNVETVDSANHTATAAVGPFSVLVIDDRRDASYPVVKFLEKEGHRVLTAFDGPSGVAEARQHAPQIVICDIGLPGFDGYEVARQLRADANFDSSLLIAVTGYGLSQDKNEAQCAGFDCHLVKPVNRGLLLKEIESWAARSGPLS